LDDTLPLLKNGKRKQPNKQERKAAEKQAREEEDAERNTTRKRFETRTSFFFRKLDGTVGVKIKQFDWKKLEGRKHKRGGVHEHWVIQGVVEAENAIELVFPITSVKSFKCDQRKNSLSLVLSGFDQGKTIPRVYVQKGVESRYRRTKFEEVKLDPAGDSGSSDGDGDSASRPSFFDPVLRLPRILPPILSSNLPIEEQAKQLLKHISKSTPNADGTFQVNVEFPGKYEFNPYYEQDDSNRCFHKFKEYMEAIGKIQKENDKQKKDDEKIQKQREAQAAKLAAAAKKAAAKKTAAGKKKGQDNGDGASGDGAQGGASGGNASNANSNTPSFADIPASKAPWLHKAVSEFKLNVFPSTTGGPGFLDMKVLDSEWEVYVLQRRKFSEEVERLKVGAIAKIKKLYGWSEEEFEGEIPANKNGNPDKTMSELHLAEWGELLEEYETEYSKFNCGERESKFNCDPEWVSYFAPELVYK
jgi:hypothetical protein